jgi:hypothetical protein
MTRITTGCPGCGRVELEVDDVTLVVSPREENAWYLFDCTGCARRIVKPAPSTVAVALTSVRVRTWAVPAEMLERVAPGDAPAITVDDVLDALLWLSTGADLVTAAAGPEGADLDQSGPGGPTFGTTNPSPDARGSRPARPNAA